jgi:hypothetical protein
MRKLFLAVALVSLLLGAASCAKETGESLVTKEGVSFKAALGKQTRATETTLATLITDNAQLDVYAYRVGDTDLEFGDPFELTYDATKAEWTYSPVRYQPGMPLRYYSLYPSQGAPATTTGLTASDYALTYTIKGTQEDLIAAYVPATDLEVITLTYNHLLSQVNFAVQGLEDVKIVVSDMEVDKVMDTNTYTFSSATWSGTPSQSAGFVAYAYTPVTASLTTLAAGTSTDIVYLGNGGGTNTYDNALMLMPQEFDPAKAGSDGIFSFTYSIDLDTNGDGTFDKNLATSKSVEVNFSDFQTVEWEAGKRYVYVIDFSSYVAGGPITFKVDVTDWEDGTTPATEIAQTVQVAQMTTTDIRKAIELQAAAKAANSALTVFPISIEGSATAKINFIYGFATGDKIRLEFVDQAAADKLTIGDLKMLSGWTVDEATNTDNIVVLTCVTPSQQGATIAANMTGVDNDTKLLTAIYTALDDLTVSPTVGKHTLYTVTVGQNFDANVEIDLSGVTLSSFATGDTIRLVFNSSMPGITITTATGWELSNDGNTFYLIKE